MGLNRYSASGRGIKTNNIKDTYDFLSGQLLTGLKGVSGADLENVIIAYEPVWAIGASESAPLDYTADIIRFLRKLLAEKFGREASERQTIFYGGAVNPDTAPGILSLEKNDGIFIGRASLDVDYFIKLIEMTLKVCRSRS